MGAIKSIKRRSSQALSSWYIAAKVRTHRLARRLMRGWWAWELLAAAVCTSATIVLVTILVAVDGRPAQPLSIGSLKLTLNTIVAAIATVIRAALVIAIAGALAQSQWNRFASREAATFGRPLRDLELFAEAATSWWGSLRLIWRTRGQHLAALGALVMLLSLASDTFVQQILSTQVQSLPSDVIPTVNKSVPLISTTLLQLPVAAEPVGAVDVDEGAPQGGTRLQKLSELLYVPDIIPLHADCPSDNCTWPVIPTVGACSSCEDLKNTSSWEFDNATSTLVFKVPRQAKDQESTRNGPAEYFTLQNSVDMSRIQTEGFNLTNLTTLELSDEPLWREKQQAISLVYYHLGITPQGSKLIQNPMRLSANMTGAKLKSETLNPVMAAYVCRISICIQAYDLNQKTLIGTWDRMEYSRPGGGRPETEGNWTFLDIPSAMNVHDPSVFVVSESHRQRGAKVMRALYGGQEKFIGGKFRDSITDDFGASPFPQAFFLASDTLSSMSDFAVTLAHEQATAMRNVYPMTRDPFYLPKAYETVIVVKVTWQWLAFPLVVYLMAAVFMAATIVETRRLPILPWKAHRMPLLLANLDESIQWKAEGGLLERRGLEDRVGLTNVRLVFSGKDDISFRKVQVPRERIDRSV